MHEKISKQKAEFGTVIEPCAMRRIDSRFTTCDLELI
jgi:hypothetical protein